jgi:integrase
MGRSRRLIIVRGFARYCAIEDPRTQIPAAGLLGSAYVRRVPHIFTPDQVRLIMQRAGGLPKISPLRPRTFETFFGLLACTGLRPGEARRLRLGDFDPVAGTLQVPATKFSPERRLPLHPSTVQALVRYQRLRTFLVAGDHFFVSHYGRPLRTCLIDRAFRRVTADIPGNGDRPRPRPHDFRHTFATNWIAQCSHQTRPLSHYLLRLASYLGHRNMEMTWWYVSSDRRALEEAAERFAHHRHGRDR